MVASQWLWSARKVDGKFATFKLFSRVFWLESKPFLEHSRYVKPPQATRSMTHLWVTGVSSEFGRSKEERGTRGFNYSFLSPRSSPGLESGKYQLISSPGLIGYILPMFRVVWKRSRFSRKIMENASLIWLVLHTGRIGTRNQNPRPLSNSFWCHKSNSSLKISKQFFIRNHVSRGKLNHLDLHEFLITWYLGLCYGNRAYPWTRVNE